MIHIVELNDPAAPGVLPYFHLTDAQLRSRLEPEKGLLIAEGTKVIGHALDAGLIPLSFLMERRHITGKAAPLLARCGKCTVYTGDTDFLNRIAGFPLTRGILCALQRPAPVTAESVCRPSRRLAILENVTDAANIGAIFRNAAALGMDGLLLSPSCCDPFHRRAVRVSMGTVFQVPWAYCPQTAWPSGVMTALKQNRFETAALALRPDALSIDDPQLASAAKLALLLGSEGDGLREDTLSCCDHTVIIPMHHGADSMNVAAASAVAFWELRVRA